MNINIMVVSHRHFAGDDLVDILREYMAGHPVADANVRFHVVYRAPYALSMARNMDIIIGNIRIKKSDKPSVTDDLYHSIRELARVYDIAHIRMSVARHMPQKVVRAIKKSVEQKSQALTCDPA